MSIDKLGSIQVSYHETCKNRIDYESEKINQFMQTTIDTIKDQSDEIANLRQELAKKMEGNEMVNKKQLTENKHRALLNNCVDSDEAILHKREIKGVKG